MRATCFFVGIVSAVLSVSVLLLGAMIATGTDWVPSRSISLFELTRAELARNSVEAEAKRLGRLPTYVEFQDWIAHAPPELRVEGQGFNYWPEQGQYSFSWWDGDAFVTWYPARDRGLVLISPKDVFVFGSKLMDLVVFFGGGIIMLMAAVGLFTVDRRAVSHAS